MAKLFGNASVRQGQRSFNRLRLGIPAVLILAHGRMACTLGDISVRGARVFTEMPISSSQSAELVFDRYRLFCTVTWSKGASAGLAFADPLTQADMQRFLTMVSDERQSA